MGGEWRKIPFSEAVQLNPPVNLIRGATYPFVDMASITPSSCSVFASEQREFAGGGSRFAVGDTLMARITPCLENGKIARFAGQPGEIAHGSTEFIVIRGREGVSESNYAYYLTKWEGVSGYAISQMTGTSGRQRVPIETFDHLEVPLPPLPEQRAIAHILGTLDDKIELNRRMSQTLEAMARALFKAWFVDFEPVRAKMEGRWKRGQSLPGLPAHLYDLFPDRLVDSELGKIPEGWRVTSIYDITEVIYGAPFASAQFNTEGIGEPLIRIRDIPSELPSVWTTEIHPKAYKVRAGDIVVGMDGEFRAYLWGGSEAWLNQRICVFKPKHGWTAAFVRNTIIDQLARVETTETATTVIHLGKSDIDLFKALLPTQPLRDVFNGLIQPLYDRIVRAKCESRTLAALRDTLLPKLIRGEIRVKGSERFLKEWGL